MPQANRNGQAPRYQPNDGSICLTCRHRSFEPTVVVTESAQKLVERGNGRKAGEMLTLEPALPPRQRPWNELPHDVLGRLVALEKPFHELSAKSGKRQAFELGKEALVNL